MIEFYLATKCQLDNHTVALALSQLAHLDVGVMRGRNDMTGWVMHFVHDRSPGNEQGYWNEDLDFRAVPYEFSESTLPNGIADIEYGTRSLPRRAYWWGVREEEHPLPEEASASTVLERILEGGYIRAGWSFRNGRPTIYGPQSAACFTEMPLHALIEYAKARNDADRVQMYAIALRKREFYEAGGRPVIYGLTSQHREIPSSEGEPRLLHPDCGIGEHEQYRYVSTNMGGSRPIDWTHEREWRWCDSLRRCSCPGLPLWLAEEPIGFSRIIVVVPTQADAEEVLDQLTVLGEEEFDQYETQRVISTIQATRVISIEKLLEVSEDVLSGLRLEDVPALQLQAVELPAVSPTLIAEVIKAFSAADLAAEAAAKAFVEKHNGGSSGPFGFVYLLVGPPRSDVVQAMVQLGYAEVHANWGHALPLRRWSSFDNGTLNLREVSAEAFQKVLRDTFPGLECWTRSVLD